MDSMAWENGKGWEEMGRNRKKWDNENVVTFKMENKKNE